MGKKQIETNHVPVLGHKTLHPPKVLEVRSPQGQIIKWDIQACSMQHLWSKKIDAKSTITFVCCLNLDKVMSFVSALFKGEKFDKIGMKLICMELF